MAKNQNARSKQQHTFINIIVKSISIEGNSLVVSSPYDINVFSGIGIMSGNSIFLISLREAQKITVLTLFTIRNFRF